MTRADGARTRQRILEIALPLFAERGYAGTSIRMLATAADVNVATLAYHFTDKDGLYNAVISRLHEDIVTQWPQLELGQTPDPISMVVEQIWMFAKAHRVHIRLAFRHLLDAERHPDVVLGNWAGEGLERADQLLLMLRPDLDHAQRRFITLSMVHLTVRYTLEDPDQLASMLGVEHDPNEFVIRELTNLLKRQLGL